MTTIMENVSHCVVIRPERDLEPDPMTARGRWRSRCGAAGGFAFDLAITGLLSVGSTMPTAGRDGRDAQFKKKSPEESWSSGLGVGCHRRLIKQLLPPLEPEG
jgi:hypothetical protein